MIPPTYHTKRFTLQAYRLEDEERFIEMALDPISIKFMGGATGDETKERQLFHKCQEIYKRQDERWFWLWGVYQHNQLCAHFELKETEHTLKDELEIVYMVHPAERGKGLMTEILSFLKVKQHDLQKRIIATVSPENVNSISLLEKWGVEKREVLKDDETGKEYLKFLLTID